MIAANAPEAKIPARVACVKAMAETKESPEVTKVELPAPVTFLHNLFAATDMGRRLINEQQKQSSFQKPSQEAIDAYDLEAVKAIREGNVTKLRELTQQGRSMNACNRFGESIMHMACRRGDLDIIRFLLFEAHVPIETRDDFGRTPLHDAIWTSKPNLEVMDVLITVAPPEILLARDVRGHTPFHYARKEHWDKWMKFLEERREVLLRRVSMIKAIG